MSKKVLETLFNSRARVRLLRFLFRNYPQTFTIKELAKHLQEDRLMIKKEVSRLQQIDLLIRDKKS
ncbi:MAG: hypothetical protein HYX21_03310 [Candidatus Yanofskybacteria bacterium]|nr:hypothetical protein [Candidatus Yanofskybacteria bacterium]